MVYLSGAGLPRLSGEKSCQSGAVVVVVVVVSIQSVKQKLQGSHYHYCNKEGLSKKSAFGQACTNEYINDDDYDDNNEDNDTITPMIH